MGRWSRLPPGIASYAMTEAPFPTAGRLPRVLRIAAVIAAMLGGFWWIYLAGFPGIEDANPESMSTPLSAGWLARARQEGVSVTELFSRDPSLLNSVNQDPTGAFCPPFQFFRLEHEVYAGPLYVPLYMPFVRAFGVSLATIEAYSAFCSAGAILLIAWLAWKTLGKGHAVFTVLSLFSSLAWLIHVKVGSPQPFLCVGLMAMLMFGAHEHARSGRRRWLALCGLSLGLMYLSAWIVFACGVIALGLSLALLSARRPGEALRDGSVIALVALLVILVVILAYSAWCRVDPRNVLADLLMMYLGRFQQGEPGFERLTMGEKMAYAFQCLFLDMRTMDGHVDKCLEGSPGVPLLTAALFVVGLLYAIKERSLIDRLLLIWLAATFAPLGTLFVYGHRYALLGLPAMAMLAARGAHGLTGDLKRWHRGLAGPLLAVLLLAGMVATILSTRASYYVDYRFYKAPDFEMDRMRGHAAVNSWLRENTSREDTLVVLGDPVMFPTTCFLFHTFDAPYPFLFWSNYFTDRSPAERVAAWELEVLRHYRRIVYVFSTLRVTHPQCRFGTNDWRAFRAAHPGLRPSWSYSYARRNPSIVLYCIEPGANPRSAPAAIVSPPASNNARP